MFTRNVTTSANAASMPSDGRWHHIAISVGGGDVKVYVDAKTLVNAPLVTRRTSILTSRDAFTFYGGNLFKRYVSIQKTCRVVLGYSEYGQS